SLGQFPAFAQRRSEVAVLDGDVPAEFLGGTFRGAVDVESDDHLSALHQSCHVPRMGSVLAISTARASGSDAARISASASSSGYQIPPRGSRTRTVSSVISAVRMEEVSWVLVIFLSSAPISPRRMGCRTILLWFPLYRSRYGRQH